MPMFRNSMEQANRNMSMIIPLMMRMKKDKDDLAFKEKTLQLAKDELDAEANERAEKFKEEAQKVRIKTLQEQHKTGYEAKDENLVRSSGMSLKRLGQPTMSEEVQSPMLTDQSNPSLRWLTKPDEPDELTGRAKNLETILGRKPTLKELKEYGQDEAKPYYTPVQTSTGLQRFNNRTGTAEPMTGPGGKNLLPVSADPGLAGRKKTAEKEATYQAERIAAYPKSRNTLNSLTTQWDNVDSAIDKALDMVSPFTTGMGAWAAAIPATPQKNLKETLGTIKANIGFDKLQDMRANSPTGGALGQVSDMENKLLQAVQGSLDQSQSASELKKNLKTIKTTLQKLRAQKEFAFKYDYKDLIEDSAKITPKVGTVDGDYEFIGGDPADSKSWKKVKK